MKWTAWLMAGTLLLAAAPGSAQAMDQPPTRNFGLVLKPFFNQPTSQTFTMLGVEMLRAHDGWLGGLGWYGGSDLGIKSYSSWSKYGGLLLRREWGDGPIILSTGLLGGFGYTANMYPNVTFSNVFIFGALEPQIGLVQVFPNGARLGVDLSYLATSVSDRVGGPAVALRFSMPLGRHMMR